MMHSLVLNWLTSAVLPTPGAPTMATRWQGTGFLSWGSGACAGDDGAREPDRERRRRKESPRFTMPGEKKLDYVMLNYDHLGSKYKIVRPLSNWLERTA